MSVPSILLIPGQIALVWLIADFITGFVHWLEDAYGNPDLPVLGQHMTRPNLLHHYAPRAIVDNSWFRSARGLLAICVLLGLVAAALGVFNWMVALGLFLSANANEVHKWSHRTRRENGPVVRLLQRLRLVQSPSHHHRHHAHEKNSNYCILTDFLNPVLERVQFWSRLEWVVLQVFGVPRRDEDAVAARLVAEAPETFGPYLPIVVRRLGRHHK